MRLSVLVVAAAAFGCTAREPPGAGSLSKPGAVPVTPPAPPPDAGPPPPPSVPEFVPPLAGPPVHPADALCSASLGDYEVIDTGTLGGGPAWLSSVNRSGKAAGAAFAGPDLTHAIVYDVATRTLVDLTASGLSGPAIANAISDSGTIAGTFDLAPENYFPFAISPSGVWLDLGLLDAERMQSRGATAVNSLGHVAGYTVRNGESHAFLWRDGAVLDLGTLGGPSSAAFALNDSDEVAGFFRLADGTARPFVSVGGEMRDLGTLGGSAAAYGINSSGVVVGASQKPDGSVRAFRYDGRLSELRVSGPLANSVATSIDARGRIVGWTTDFATVYLSPLSGRPTRAFLLLEDGSEVDLSARYLEPAGFQTAQAFSIGSSGIIAGGGTCGGAVHGFLLVPRSN